MIKTSCKECVFATIHLSKVLLDPNKKNEAKQDGCMLGKLERFKEIGTSIKEVDGFAEIQGRICMFCRDQKWVKEKGVKGSIAVKAVNEEAQIKHTYVVLYNTEDNINFLFETLEDIEHQSITPFEVYIINNSHRYKESQKIFDFTNNLFVNKGSVFFVQTIFNKFTGRDGDADVNYDNDYLMDLYLPKIKGNWFTIVQVPQKINNDFTKNLNDIINVKLEKFVALLPSYGLSGSTFQTYAARVLGGNRPDPNVEGLPLLSLIEKLNYAEEHKEEGSAFQEIMTKNLEEVCPI